MERKPFPFSTAKTLKTILIYFLLFLAGDLVNSLVFDWIFSAVKLPDSDLYVILRMSGCLLLTYAFFWLYTTKVLHLSMKDFGITFGIQKWGILLSVLLPAFVVAVYLCIGKTEVNVFALEDIVFLVIASVSIALKSGILEEMLFRGFIMKLLENRWNPYIAIGVPSVLFGLVHIPSMTHFTFGGVVLLMIAGTLVGIMFSLVAYGGNSISNGALMHALWNFFMVTDILHITTEQGAYGKPLFSVIIPSDNILLTGAGFGVEASLAAIIGYALVCGAVIYIQKNKTVLDKSL